MDEQIFPSENTPDETLNTPRPPFEASRTELLAALLMFVTAYLYMCFFEHFDGLLLLPAVAAGLIAGTELLHWSVPRSWESWVWLGCFLVCTASAALGIERVWYLRQTLLFVHIFAVWWVLSRSGKLLEGKSGHLLPLDALNGFILLPFGGFFLRIRTLWWGLRQLRPTREQTSARRWGWLTLAAGLCLLLFIAATGLLMQADAGFSALLERLEPLLHLRLDGALWLRLGLSLPVGAWLFGLTDGARRQPVEQLETRRAKTAQLLAAIQKVPAGFWMGIVGVFSALYLAFFVLQGSYLFGAFTRTLPEGFIVSEYARQGFFELCKVMALNFALLWLVTRMVSPETRQRKGFLAGCVLWAWSLLTGRPVFRKWMVFGAVSLSLLTLL